MSDQFFSLFFRVYYELQYYTLYKEHSHFWNNFFTILIAVASCGSIAAWYCFDLYSMIWPLFVGSMQVVQAIFPHLNYAKRITPLTYVIQDYSHIYNQMHHDWNTLYSKSDDEISKLIFSYEQKISAIQDRYLDNVPMPYRKKLRLRAERESETKFKYEFNTQFERT